MIRFTFILLVCLWLVPNHLFSQNVKDTTKKNDILLDVVEITSPKEYGAIQTIPAAVSVFPESYIEDANILTIKDLSSHSPGLFIPDYGSKLTSAVYIRGVGSRIGGSSVGFYVDDVPYSNQYSFDFDFFDIKNVEILRGPQGTLYGRNSLGGIIHIHTLSAMDFQGTKIRLSAANPNDYQVTLSHYQKIKEKTAFSIGGHASSFGGFFKNQYTGKNVDAEWSAAARGQFDWYINPNLKLKYNLSYEHSHQNGYAYGAYDENTQKVADVDYNDPTLYDRNLLNNSVQLNFQTKKIKLISTTGYQYLNDSMMLDQDFTANPVFKLTQTQNLNNINQEIVVRSNDISRFQWIAGVFGFYETLKTNAPVTFEEDGVRMIQSFIPQTMPITIANDNIYIENQFKTPGYGLAAFAQGTLNRLFGTDLSATAGLRLDYEKRFLDAYTATEITYNLPPFMSPEPFLMKYMIEGKTDVDFMPLLPKISLKYEFPGFNMVYASIARGYKSGGYNIQMFSDLLQNKMRNDYMNLDTSKIDLNSAASFKPEYSWNYEIGAHTTLIKNRLMGNIALFYIQLNDQQIAEFAPTGAGRMIKNAGESRSYGAEVSLRAALAKELNLSLAYGFTMAEFTDYSIQLTDSTSQDFAGNRIPFTPEHTLSVTVDYTLNLNKRALDRIIFDVQCNAAGKIYWTEENDVYQPFYALLNANIAFEKNWFRLSLWGKNLTNNDYLAFYFESMGNAFAQKGKPLQVGATISAEF